jgi:hypothetical protein
MFIWFEPDKLTSYISSLPLFLYLDHSRNDYDVIHVHKFMFWNAARAFLSHKVDYKRRKYFDNRVSLVCLTWKYTSKSAKHISPYTNINVLRS